MAKPTKLPVWATDLSNVTEPASGQKDTGWTNNQPAISSYFNWLFYTIYLWLVYLDNGVFDGPITIDGDALIQNDLLVNGDTTVGGDLEAANLYHADPVALCISPVAARTSLAFEDEGIFTTATGAGIIRYPIPVRAGDRIKSWTLYVQKDSPSAEVISVQLYRHTAGSPTATPIGAPVANNANAPGTITLSLAGLDEEVTTMRTYYLAVGYSGIAGTDYVRDAIVAVARPR